MQSIVNTILYNERFDSIKKMDYSSEEHSRRMTWTISLRMNLEKSTRDKTMALELMAATTNKTKVEQDSMSRQVEIWVWEADQL